MQEVNGLAPALKKIKPLIKWTGGKYEEYQKFAHLIPPFKRYIEPFFGGGGVFFALRSRVPALLNDKSLDLFRFYSLLSSPLFQQQLLHYADAWDAAGLLANDVVGQLTNSFHDYIHDKISKHEFESKIAGILVGISAGRFSPLFEPEFIIDATHFTHKLQVVIADKCRRIKAISQKENRLFNAAELADHIETGIKSGLFLYLRGLMNKAAAGRLSLSPEKAAANWYFVREFCYASMFRFNGKGEFNIPYGGIAYNKKNFRQKVEKIFSDDVKTLFSNATFSNLDFNDFLKNISPAKNDFIFLDPPYDSEFSEYDQNAFTRGDQERLRDALIKLPAKWMVVIKETDFIRGLYSCPPCRIIEFDKTYTFNVRGRNNRDTKHLIIVNYDI